MGSTSEGRMMFGRRFLRSQRPQSMSHSCSVSGIGLISSPHFLRYDTSNSEKI